MEKGCGAGVLGAGEGAEEAGRGMTVPKWPNPTNLHEPPGLAPGPGCPGRGINTHVL
jgi:hypothetical protein